MKIKWKKYSNCVSLVYKVNVTKQNARDIKKFDSNIIIWYHEEQVAQTDTRIRSRSAISLVCVKLPCRLSLWEEWETHERNRWQHGTS